MGDLEEGREKNECMVGLGGEVEETAADVEQALQRNVWWAFLLIGPSFFNARIK